MTPAPTDLPSEEAPASAAPAAPPPARTKRALGTLATSILATLVTVLLSMVTQPLILRWLGDTDFGVCKVLLEFAGYLAILELGVGGALSAMMVKAVNGGNDADVRRVLVVGVRVNTILLLLMIGVGLASLPLLGFFLHMPAESMPACRLGWALALLSIALLPLSPLRTLVETEQRGYWNNLATIVQLVLTTLVAVWLAWGGWGIPGQMFAPFAGQIPMLAFLGGLLIVRFPGVLGRIFYGQTDPATWKELWRLNLPTVIFNLCGRISLLTDYIILSKVAGPVFVTSLFFTQRLAVIIQGLLTAIGSASWAGLAQLHTRGDHEQFNQRLTELSGIICVLASACLLPVAAFNTSFVRLWVGSEIYGGELTTYLAIANAVMLALLSLWGWCFTSTGRIRLLVPVSIVNAAVNFTVSVVATWLLGVPGPLLGTFVGFAGVMFWWEALLLRREFGTPLGTLAWAIGRPLALAVPCYSVLRTVEAVWPTQGWVHLTLVVGASVVGYLLLCWVLIFSRAERQQWLGRVRSFVGA